MDANSPVFDKNTSSHVATLLQQIATQGPSLDLSNSESRKELLAITRSPYFALKTPMEAILRMEWAEVMIYHPYYPKPH
jgi:hypothetical protein